MEQVTGMNESLPKESYRTAGSRFRTRPAAPGKQERERPDRGAEQVPVPSLTRGLTEAEAERSRLLRGSNAVPRGKKTGFFRQFLSALNDPIIRILLFALAVNSVFSFSGPTFDSFG